MLPRKNVLDFNPLRSHSLGFRVFRTGYWPGFKIKALKISFLKSYPFLKSLTVLRKTEETGLDPGLVRKVGALQVFDGMKPNHVPLWMSTNQGTE